VRRPAPARARRRAWHDRRGRSASVPTFFYTCEVTRETEITTFSSSEGNIFAPHEG
jgi:hypothetical protein